MATCLAPLALASAIGAVKMISGLATDDASGAVSVVESPVVSKTYGTLAGESTARAADGLVGSLASTTGTLAARNWLAQSVAPDGVPWSAQTLRAKGRPATPPRYWLAYLTVARAIVTSFVLSTVCV